MALFRRSAGKYNTSVGHNCLPTIDLKGEFYDPIKHEHLFMGGVTAALQFGNYNSRNILEIDLAKVQTYARVDMAIPQRDLAYICGSFRDNHFSTAVTAAEKNIISSKILGIIDHQYTTGQLSPVVCKMFREAVEGAQVAPVQVKSPGLFSRLRIATNVLLGRGLQPI